MSFSDIWYLAMAAWWFGGLALFAYVPRLRDRDDAGGLGCIWVLGGVWVLLVGGLLLAFALGLLGVDPT